MKDRDLYMLKKNLCKIGWLFGYLFGCLPIIVGLYLGIKGMELFDWVRYEVTK